VHVAARAGQMFALRPPEILLDVLSGNVAVVINEVAHVEELVGFGGGVAVGLDDCAGDDA